VSKLNYKTDGQKAFKFMNKLNNKYIQKQLQPLKVKKLQATEKLQTALVLTLPMPTN
jgi:hypothetical protein